MGNLERTISQPRMFRARNIGALLVQGLDRPAQERFHCALRWRDAGSMSSASIRRAR
jgi:hypothetical protein